MQLAVRYGDLIMAQGVGFEPSSSISSELGLREGTVAAAIRLLEEGNTVPFIARYRKEATSNLDEVQLRTIEERRDYLKELHERRGTVLETINGQGKLTDALRAKINGCTTKTELEDLYLPYRPKRRTRAAMARERGLEPLADKIRSLAPGNPSDEARAYVSPDLGVPDSDAALAGARDIVAEEVAERAEVRSYVRGVLTSHGLLTSQVMRGKKDAGKKFEQYFDYKEPARTVPSHRYLAIRRGESEGMLRVRIDIELDRMLPEVQRQVGWRPGRGFAEQYGLAIEDACSRLLLPSLESEVRAEIKEASDRDAIEVFARNMENLLLAAPFGSRGVVGIDPGIRTGCKCVALDATGKLLEHVTIFPQQSGAKMERAARDLTRLLRKTDCGAVAVGNGTGGRETEAFVRSLLKHEGIDDVAVVAVNEAGASIYSASDVAREEFPDLDLTIRGAVSIGRRLQDPLAELVKIEPRSIGVGQYQHDVNQPLLKRKLDEVVETCVNRVGVELNTASAPLLSYVAGIGSGLAKKIVAHREASGSFTGRKHLLDVAGLGRKTFEQAAGFLRVRGGVHPLDASAVHPERYRLVERMAKDLGAPVEKLVGNEDLASRVEVQRYLADDVGELTLGDIVAELKKPGRDPRDSFEAPEFRDDVNSMEDLDEGMQLEGVVTNVTDFGAFVDVGVHQDGLVHISQLADRFVRDPHEVVQVGQKINVRVLSVDIDRKRIGLTARSRDA